MTDQPALFDSYQDIVTHYIASFEKANLPFSRVSDGKLNPDFRYLEKFLHILQIELDGHQFYTLTKVMLSAKEGKILYYDYTAFKNIAHLVLDKMPKFWMHFRLVLKTYQHQDLVKDILNDAKIQQKLKDKSAEIDHPEHQYNSYLEFLCPELDGKLIGWGLGEDLSSDTFAYNRNSYPVHVLKNFLKNPSEILQGDFDSILSTLKQYVLFKLQKCEAIPQAYLNVFFDFIVQQGKDQPHHFLNQFYGDHETDVMFKALLNPIVGLLDLSYLIENVGFCDNCCTFIMKDAKAMNYDLDTDIGWQNQNNKDMLRVAIDYCEKLVSQEDSYFYVERVNFY